ncbi:hypothetical protein [Salinisphaera sp. T31B1]|uniref:hypothetical protein n=1 Tax=Salinisphaera sp. T31B1 TaxID=727963 RepID=UPI0033423197
MNRRRIAFIAYLSLWLAGCSDAPDARDVEQAIERNLQATLAQHAQLAERIGGHGAREFTEHMGMPDAHGIDISDVSIRDRRARDNGDYELNITYQATVGDISRRSSTPVVIGRRDGQWTVLN